MVQPQENGTGPVHGIRLSTVGSPRPSNLHSTHEPTGLDMAMKLHYLKVAYIFSAQTAGAITVERVKETMFVLFEQIPWTTGRFSRHESGRPYIKCNDCGARFVEGHCDFTVDEWLNKRDRADDEILVYHKPIGPELSFSPLIYIQMTRFKCGGLSLGLSWAHVLGDVFSLSHAFKQWALAYANKTINIPRPFLCPNQNPNPVRSKSGIIKRVDPVGDLWVTPNKKKMASFSFNPTISQLSPYLPKKAATEENENQVLVFETLCGVIWKCIARSREQPDPVTVTVIRKNPTVLKPRSLRNDQVINSVEINFSAADAYPEELAIYISEATDVRFQIDEIGDSDDGASDFIVYGAKLTFVDLSEVDFYGVRLMENSPESVYCDIKGIGDEGAVVVLPAAKPELRVVTMTLPEEEIERVKSELKQCGVFGSGNGVV